MTKRFMEHGKEYADGIVKICINFDIFFQLICKKNIGSGLRKEAENMINFGLHKYFNF